MENQLLHGDCLVVMNDIADQSIDMILCDLPYGMTEFKWDSPIPLDELWTHYKRIIKLHGAIVLTASQPFTSALVMSNPQWFRHEWIWEKDAGSNFMHVNRMPFKVHESVLVFSNKAPVYYPQMRVGDPYSVSPSGKFASNYRGKKRIPSFSNGTRYPRSVIKFNREGGLHPTQKPVALFEYLIKTYTQEGETVLDNCAGSGTTAVAAINTKRNYICIEIDEKYFNVMKERIDGKPWQEANKGKAGCYSPS